MKWTVPLHLSPSLKLPQMHTSKQMKLINYTQTIEGMISVNSTAAARGKYFNVAWLQGTPDFADSIPMLKPNQVAPFKDLILKQKSLLWKKCFTTEMYCVSVSFLCPLLLQFILEVKRSFLNWKNILN